jgi:hypothetical protein
MLCILYYGRNRRKVGDFRPANVDTKMRSLKEFLHALAMGTGQVIGRPTGKQEKSAYFTVNNTGVGTRMEEYSF